MSRSLLQQFGTDEGESDHQDILMHHAYENEIHSYDRKRVHEFDHCQNV